MCVAASRLLPSAVKSRGVAQEASDIAREVADDALALVETDTNKLVRTFREVSNEVIKYAEPIFHQGEGHWRNARDVSYTSCQRFS